MTFPSRPEDAAEFVASALAGKPELMIGKDLTVAARAARNMLANSGRVFARGGRAVRLVLEACAVPVIEQLDQHGATNAVHALCQPVRPHKDGGTEPTTFPERAAMLTLALSTSALPPLNGVITSPLLTEEGEIRAVDGYDAETGIWCSNPPGLAVPARPNKAEAAAALLVLRKAIATFAFADAERVFLPDAAVPTVDLTTPPGADESAALVAILTAVCRASLALAPGFKFAAPAVSGAGSGKGLLVRTIAAIAYGAHPSALTAGHDRNELDKRIGSAAMQAGPVLFLDNLNGMALRSDALASLLTETVAQLRVLGRSELVPLNCRAFVALTGNGLSLSEDLARRFLACDLDAKIEDPEARPFAPGYLGGIFACRTELLTAALTIWRWGRQAGDGLQRGLSLGSYERWAEWVRDPLLALGCRDPVARIAEAKAADPHRRRVAELYAEWDRCHGRKGVKAAELAETVKDIADPHGRGRQWLATFLMQLSGTRAAGFVLIREKAGAKWSPSTYVLQSAADADWTDDPAKPAW